MAKAKRSKIKRIALHPVYIFSVMLVLALSAYSVGKSSADQISVKAVVLPNSQNQSPPVEHFNFINWVHEYIWEVAPAATVGGLMTASFWLGEKETVWHLRRLVHYGHRRV